MVVEGGVGDAGDVDDRGGGVDREGDRLGRGVACGVARDDLEDVGAVGRELDGDPLHAVEGDGRLGRAGDGDGGRDRVVVEGGVGDAGDVDDRGGGVDREGDRLGRGVACGVARDDLEDVGAVGRELDGDPLHAVEGDGRLGRAGDGDGGRDRVVVEGGVGDAGDVDDRGGGVDREGDRLGRGVACGVARDDLEDVGAVGRELDGDPLHAVEGDGRLGRAGDGDGGRDRVVVEGGVGDAGDVDDRGGGVDREGDRLGRGVACGVARDDLEDVGAVGRELDGDPLHAVEGDGRLGRAGDGDGGRDRVVVEGGVGDAGDVDDRGGGVDREGDRLGRGVACGVARDDLEDVGAVGRELDGDPLHAVEGDGRLGRAGDGDGGRDRVVVEGGVGDAGDVDDRGGGVDREGDRLGRGVACGVARDDLEDVGAVGRELDGDPLHAVEGDGRLGRAGDGDGGRDRVVVEGGVGDAGDVDDRGGGVDREGDRLGRGVACGVARDDLEDVGAVGRELDGDPLHAVEGDGRLGRAGDGDGGRDRVVVEGGVGDAGDVDDRGGGVDREGDRLGRGVACGVARDDLEDVGAVGRELDGDPLHAVEGDGRLGRAGDGDGGRDRVVVEGGVGDAGDVDDRGGGVDREGDRLGRGVACGVARDDLEDVGAVGRELDGDPLHAVEGDGRLGRAGDGDGGRDRVVVEGGVGDAGDVDDRGGGVDREGDRLGRGVACGVARDDLEDVGAVGRELDGDPLHAVEGDGRLGRAGDGDGGRDRVVVEGGVGDAGDVDDRGGGVDREGDRLGRGVACGVARDDLEDVGAVGRELDGDPLHAVEGDGRLGRAGDGDGGRDRVVVEGGVGDAGDVDDRGGGVDREGDRLGRGVACGVARDDLEDVGAVGRELDGDPLHAVEGDGRLGRAGDGDGGRDRVVVEGGVGDAGDVDDRGGGVDREGDRLGRGVACGVARDDLEDVGAVGRELDGDPLHAVEGDGRLGRAGDGDGGRDRVVVEGGVGDAGDVDDRGGGVDREGDRLGRGVACGVARDDLEDVGAVGRELDGDPLHAVEGDGRLGRAGDGDGGRDRVVVEGGVGDAGDVDDRGGGVDREGDRLGRGVACGVARDDLEDVGAVGRELDGDPLHAVEGDGRLGRAGDGDGGRDRVVVEGGVGDAGDVDDRGGGVDREGDRLGRGVACGVARDDLEDVGAVGRELDGDPLHAVEGDGRLGRAGDGDGGRDRVVVEGGVGDAGDVDDRGGGVDREGDRLGRGVACGVARDDLEDVGAVGRELDGDPLHAVEGDGRLGRAGDGDGGRDRVVVEGGVGDAGDVDDRGGGVDREGDRLGRGVACGVARDDLEDVGAVGRELDGDPLHAVEGDGRLGRAGDGDGGRDRVVVEGGVRDAGDVDDRGGGVDREGRSLGCFDIASDVDAPVAERVCTLSSEDHRRRVDGRRAVINAVVPRQHARESVASSQGRRYRLRGRSARQAAHVRDGWRLVDAHGRGLSRLNVSGHVDGVVIDRMRALSAHNHRSRVCG